MNSWPLTTDCLHVPTNSHFRFIWWNTKPIISSYFVIFEWFSLIVSVVPFLVFLFFFIFCVLLHCIVLSIVLPDGISVYVFWGYQCCVLRSTVFFPFNFSQPGFCSSRNCFCVSSCVEIREEMSCFFVSISFFQK